MNQQEKLMVLRKKQSSSRIRMKATLKQMSFQNIRRKYADNRFLSQIITLTKMVELDATGQLWGQGREELSE